MICLMSTIQNVAILTTELCKTSQRNMEYLYLKLDMSHVESSVIVLKFAMMRNFRKV